MYVGSRIIEGNYLREWWWHLVGAIALVVLVEL